MDLRAAVVVVTGASRGIGRATTDLLAGRGARVVGVARDAAALTELDARTGGSSLAADLADPGSAERIVEHALRTHGRLDGVVVNAGIGYVGEVGRMPAASVAGLVDVNLRAALLLARASLPALAARPPDADGRRGGLVFVSSIAGAVGVPGESVYSATKAGLGCFAELLREEVRAERIGVSTVLPGVVTTDLLRDRQVPYSRRFPRPVPPERAAAVVVRALETGAPRLFVPRWLAVPARFAGMAPGIYRALARRFG